MHPSCSIAFDINQRRRQSSLLLGHYTAAGWFTSASINATGVERGGGAGGSDPDPMVRATRPRWRCTAINAVFSSTGRTTRVRLALKWCVVFLFFFFSCFNQTFRPGPGRDIKKKINKKQKKNLPNAGVIGGAVKYDPAPPVVITRYKLRFS